MKNKRIPVLKTDEIVVMKKEEHKILYYNLEKALLNDLLNEKYINIVQYEICEKELKKIYDL